MVKKKVIAPVGLRNKKEFEKLKKDYIKMLQDLLLEPALPDHLREAVRDAIRDIKTGKLTWQSRLEMFWGEELNGDKTD